jgi:hypothetical protein
VKLGYNELGYNELGHNELGHNELGYNKLPGVPWIVARVASLLSQSACVFRQKYRTEKYLLHHKVMFCHILFSTIHFNFIILTLVGPTNVIATKFHA